jgi:hypothetical protein
MASILEKIENNAHLRMNSHPSEVFKLRGVWRCDYVLRLTQEESVFHLHYLLAQTKGQGCCYYDLTDEKPVVDESFLGKNVLSMRFKSRALQIAALDAVYSSLNGKPFKSIIIKGSNIEKAHRRATIVCNEVLSIIRKRKPKQGNKFNVLNVGVVGSFLSILTRGKKLRVKASDLYEKVAGKTVHGVTVEHGTYGSAKSHKRDTPLGTRTLELVAEADLAVVTGMTLANGTLDGILATALEHKTALLIFAETGANFASEYCKMGVDAVVSEPFPFYLTCDGPTRINIYRYRK